jgi:glutamine synthetase
MLWPDHLGLARGKYLPAKHAPAGSGFCVTTFGLGYDREISDVPGAYMLEGLKDVHASIDLDSVHPSWEDERTAVAVADLRFQGAPYPVSARTALQRAVADWEGLGYRPKVGIELEGYLLAPTADGGWARYPNPRSFVYGTGVLGEPTGFLDEVMELAERAGFAVESAAVEFDESQFEFTLEYGDALAVADDAFLFRLLVRERALALGLDFTFLGKPFPTVAGSGLHVNFSMADADGRNAFYDPHAEHGLADVGRQSVAGLCEHHRALIALCAPTVNAYRRLQPGTLAGYWANWGVDHRNVSNRIPAEAGTAMRVESRVGDGSMNVHLGVAAVLRAAWLGATAKAEPPPAYTGDGFEDGGTDVTAPTSLGEALDALEADTALAEAVGAELVANLVGVKRAELEKFDASGSTLDGDTLSEFETAFYLPYH